jgi:hypothetical protein
MATDDLGTRLARLRGVIEGDKSSYAGLASAHRWMSVRMFAYISFAEARLQEAERLDPVHDCGAIADRLAELEHCLLPEEPTTSARG